MIAILHNLHIYIYKQQNNLYSYTKDNFNGREDIFQKFSLQKFIQNGKKKRNMDIYNSNGYVFDWDEIPIYLLIDNGLKAQDFITLLSK